MFSYNISKNADNEIFKDACKKIEESKWNLIKEKEIVDVDGSIIQIYSGEYGKIKVYNDYEVDAVYIDSEIDLSTIFS